MGMRQRCRLALKVDTAAAEARHRDGESLKSIAASLGISVGALHGHLRRMGRLGERHTPRTGAERQAAYRSRCKKTFDSFAEAVQERA